MLVDTRGTFRNAIATALVTRAQLAYTKAEFGGPEYTECTWDSMGRLWIRSYKRNSDFSFRIDHDDSVIAEIDELLMLDDRKAAIYNLWETISNSIGEVRAALESPSHIIPLSNQWIAHAQRLECYRPVSVIDCFHLGRIPAIGEIVEVYTSTVPGKRERRRGLPRRKVRCEVVDGAEYASHCYPII